MNKQGRDDQYLFHQFHRVFILLFIVKTDESPQTPIGRPFGKISRSISITEMTKSPFLLQKKPCALTRQFQMKSPFFKLHP